MQCVSTVSSLWIYRIKMMLHARLHASPSKLMIVYDLERIKSARNISVFSYFMCVYSDLIILRDQFEQLCVFAKLLCLMK